MNTMWVDRLGWALLHFIWQGLAIAAVYALARRTFGRGPQSRYLLACAALAVMVAAPIATWAWLQPVDSVIVAGQRILGVLPAATTGVVYPPIAAPAGGESFQTAPAASMLFWVVTLWLAGALVFSARLAGSWMVAARLRREFTRPAPPEWQVVFAGLCRRLGLSQPVELVVSAMAQVPAVMGWLRPVVLAPVGMLAGLPTAQVEMLLLHELAHIRRRDYLVNLLQSVVEALLFYHPAVWWVSGHIRAEREHCCDDLAVAITGDAPGYAFALARLESGRQGLAVAANGGSLSARIARLLGHHRRESASGRTSAVLAAVLVLAIASLALFGQSLPHPAFQTVSIRRNPTAWSERSRHPMGMGANASLMFLIQFAYAPHANPMLGHQAPLTTSQVVGGPDWINSEGYDIDAKPAPNGDPKQYWLMWQNLLADRFKLKLHRETRELPVYAMSIAEGGLHLPPAKLADCVSFAPGEKPHHVPGKVDCGYVSGPFAEWNQMKMMGRKVRIADLARELSMVLDRPVLDKTGFTGEFDVNLTFPEQSGIQEALRNQLGLQLAPAKAPVEVLVVDHAERPR